MQLGLPFEAPRVPVSPELCFVRHRRARRYVVRVEPDGRVRVTIPRGGSKREADAFARRQSRWIQQQQERTRALAMPASEARRFRKIAEAALPARVRELAAQHGLEVSRVSIRSQRSRWGSCGRGGHICLNWRLVRMPESVRDYVIVHELMHLRRMDHSPAFWQLVAAALPGYERARQWLRGQGRQLI